MLNNNAASLHHQHDIDTVKIEDKINKLASLNLMVILEPIPKIDRNIARSFLIISDNV
jgi:hypothetical protein